MSELSLAPENVHERLLATAKPELAYSPGMDLSAWRVQLAGRLRELIGVLPEPVDLDLRVEWRKERDGYAEIRFVFTSELGADVPCHLLVPDGADQPVPVVVCLQGHSTGMHNSLARAGVSDPTPQVPDGDRDFAIQAVSRGYAALALEQRCFGERVDIRPEERRAGLGTCHHAVHVASLLGRTMVGERVWDVSRAIDALAEFPEVDTDRIACLGHSGGGTVAWYAACVDERIGAVMPSASVCTYRASIGSIDHCSDNYLPGALRYFDMPDLAGLIAPRPLVVTTGRDDPIFPIDGVREAAGKVREIYDVFGASERVELVIGDGAHRFFADDAWPVFSRLVGWHDA
ncbi:alpha/beta hydrolase family protein [Phytoactinopolyspora endophytica]|uniref:alpha/beta hydrolase family protein n=1 Tax=Phytoactinopolyspora endophytica TaxID=1642495 RepID=UPI00101C4611|nr:alpha/beta hydrolase family protein [Phytoactinopolyspora endophytica]